MMGVSGRKNYANVSVPALMIEQNVNRCVSEKLVFQIGTFAASFDTISNCRSEEWLFRLNQAL